MLDKTVYPQIYIYFFTLIHSLVGLSVAYFFSQALTPKSWVKKPFLYTIPFSLIPSIYEFLAHDSRSALRLFLFILTFSMMSLIFYQGKISYRLGSWSFCMIILSIAEWALFMIVWRVILSFFQLSYFLSYEEISISSQLTFQHLCIYFLPPVIAECILCIFSAKIWNRFAPHINLLIFLEIGFTACILYSGTLMVLPESFGNSGWLLFYFAIVLILLLFLDGIHRIRRSLYKAQIDKKKKDILNHDLEYYKKIEELNLKNRKQNHDINNHLQAIQILIKQGNIKDARQYIKEINTELSSGTIGASRKVSSEQQIHSIEL